MNFDNCRVHSVKTDQVKREHTVSFKIHVSKHNKNDIRELARFADQDASDVTLNVTRRQLPMKGFEALPKKESESTLMKEDKLPPGITFDGTTYWVTCPECGYEQGDMGRNVSCDECGHGPLPTMETPF